LPCAIQAANNAQISSHKYALPALIHSIDPLLETAYPAVFTATARLVIVLSQANAVHVSQEATFQQSWPVTFAIAPAILVTILIKPNVPLVLLDLF